jgi:hypothetical protein
VSFARRQWSAVRYFSEQGSGGPAQNGGDLIALSMGFVALVANDWHARVCDLQMMARRPTLAERVAQFLAGSFCGKLVQEIG